MNKLILTVFLVGTLSLSVSSFPQAPPPAVAGAPPSGIPAGPPPSSAGGAGTPSAVPLAGGRPPGLPPSSAQLPADAPKTLVTAHCKGKDYNWDTAKESEPEEFKKCFYGDGPSFAMCGGKEFSWEPSKEAKPAALAECEKAFLG